MEGNSDYSGELEAELDSEHAPGGTARPTAGGAPQHNHSLICATKVLIIAYFVL